MLRIGSKIKKSRKFSVQTFATLSQATDFDVAVIGGGPGGYVAAIKASQLGLKTVCIEKRETLGGTCLNVGCIPSKSLLHATHLYHQAKHGLSKYGITVENCKADITEMQKNKEQSVLSLAKGIEMLFRKNKVDLIQGTASFTGENANSLSIQTSKGERKTITAANIIIATGSSSRSLPGVEIDEKNVLSSTGALSLKSVPERFVVVGAGVTGIELVF
ncbi:hypothetical protein MHBO_002184 [Bonamia ostreae]|uniref:FAD/NAD(P)-binding domain-containing protein n=1 Tax=Bonamia ostreae TaxID=126728 RepID=A0ABV2ALH3_9EUKA